MRLTWLPDVLRSAGLTVVEHPGWRGRGRDMTRVLGVVWHHTATGTTWTDARVEQMLATDGNATTPPPLAQLGLRRDGTYVVIADGRSNHNGYGTWGNDSIGIEAYNSGKGEPWPKIQLDAYRTGTAAILRHLGLTADAVKAHRETDPKRKIDPTGIDMTAARAEIRRLLAPPQPTPPSEEPDMRYIRDTTTGDYYVMWGEQYRRLSKAQFTERDNLARLGGAPLKVTDMHPWAVASFLMRYQIVELTPAAK